METQNQPATRLHQIKPVFSSPLVVPIDENEKILEAWRNFNDLKVKLLENSDFVTIKGEKYGKKSAFRKLAFAFGISCQIEREERIEFKNGYGYEITMRASSPSKRFMTSVASCHSNEKNFNKDSDVRAIAQTRATNRAIADLIGWAAPSAEEILSEQIEQEKPREQAERESQTEEKPTEDDWFRETFAKTDKRATEPTPSTETMLSEKQRALLISLISEKIDDPVERDNKLEEIEGYSKAEAHEVISEFLNNKYS